MLPEGNEEKPPVFKHLAVKFVLLCQCSYLPTNSSHIRIAFSTNCATRKKKQKYHDTKMPPYNFIPFNKGSHTTANRINWDFRKIKKISGSLLNSNVRIIIHSFPFLFHCDLPPPLTPQQLDRQQRWERRLHVEPHLALELSGVWSRRTRLPERPP